MSSFRVIGAGLGRTGTHSLKIALERLLGGPCYHMVEVFERPADVAVWQAAANREPVDWRKLFDGYAAAVDWPAAAFWPQIAEAFPEALILFSTRDAEGWWKSADRTIFATFRRGLGPREPPGWRQMITDVFGKTFTPGFLEEGPAKAAFERHAAEVRARAPKGRLLEWRAQDGWGPLCAALGVPVPDEPFPVSNTAEEFRARARLGD
ncbi:MAG TPA: sulfotransferase [Polyangia bacterium]|nr:sulfotransferase [Polyangia bacterium]